MFGRTQVGNKDAMARADGSRGVHFNNLVQFTLDRMDPVSAALDSCVKIKISKA
jgi:hypothetical protein